VLKNFIIKSLAALNAIEGVIHIITACVSFYGMWDLGVWDWRVATAPTFDLFLGCVSLITGYVLNKIDWKHTCFFPTGQQKDEKLQGVVSSSIEDGNRTP